MRPRSAVSGNVVRIKFLCKDDTLSDAPKDLDIIPIIEISVLQAGIRRKSHVGENRTTIALIDTGADHFYIDKSFAESSGFVASGKTSPSGASGTVEDANWYRLDYQIGIEGCVKELSANFVGMPLAETGRRYQALLGMTFLKKGRLVMDFTANEYFFEFD